MSFDERETVIRIGQKSPEIRIWTNIPAHARRIRRRGINPTKIGLEIGTKAEISWDFDIPRNVRLPMGLFKCSGGLD